MLRAKNVVLESIKKHKEVQHFTRRCKNELREIHTHNFVIIIIFFDVSGQINLQLNKCGIQEVFLTAFSFKYFLNRYLKKKETKQMKLLILREFKQIKNTFCDFKHMSIIFNTFCCEWTFQKIKNSSFVSTAVTASCVLTTLKNYLFAAVDFFVKREMRKRTQK